jgi:hypothetical protein
MRGHHGASGAGPSNALEWARIIRESDARYGPFDATVAHSFGVLAVFQAARIGISTGRMAAIAGVHSLEHLVTSFARTIQLPRRAQIRFRDQIKRQVFGTSSFAWGQIVSQFDPGSDSMPLLMVHDPSDVVVGIDQARLIAGAHTGPASVMHTERLGHNRILTDPRVVDVVTEFLSLDVESPVPDSVHHENGVSNTASGPS